MKLINKIFASTLLAVLPFSAFSGAATQKSVYISSDGNTMSANMNVRFSSNFRDFFDISGSFDDYASVYFQAADASGRAFSCKVTYSSPIFDEARNLMATISPNAFITVKKSGNLCYYVQSQTYSSYIK